MFTGVEGIKESLTSAYGNDEVSVANAAMRWMVCHSQLDPRYGGKYYKSLNHLCMMRVYVRNVHVRVCVCSEYV